MFWNDPACLAIIIALSVALVVSVAFNVKSFRSFSKKYAIKLWIVEEKAQEVADVPDLAPKNSGFYKFMAVLLAAIVVALAITLYVT